MRCCRISPASCSRCRPPIHAFAKPLCSSILALSLTFSTTTTSSDEAEALVETLGLTGVFQLASFHPRYQFAGSGPDDIENYTNRSPYPMLHLLRETSVERAVEAAGDEVAAIGDRNMETLRRLGFERWRLLWLDKPNSG